MPTSALSIATLPKSLEKFHTPSENIYIFIKHLSRLHLRLVWKLYAHVFQSLISKIGKYTITSLHSDDWIKLYILVSESNMFTIVKESNSTSHLRLWKSTDIWGTTLHFGIYLSAFTSLENDFHLYNSLYRNLCIYLSQKMAISIFGILGIGIYDVSARKMTQWLQLRWKRVHNC